MLVVRLSVFADLTDYVPQNIFICDDKQNSSINGNHYMCIFVSGDNCDRSHISFSRPVESGKFLSTFREWSEDPIWISNETTHV